MPCAHLRERIHDPDSVFPNCFKGLTFWTLNKNFQETASLSIVLSLFVHTTSLKHYRDYNIQAEFKPKCFSHALLALLIVKMSGLGFGHFSTRS